jgi:hypothetical protein
MAPSDTTVSTEVVAQERVMRLHPKAFVHVQEGVVKIRIKEQRRRPCVACGMLVNEDKLPRDCEAIGEGSTEAAAWEDAAKKLSLI